MLPEGLQTLDGFLSGEAERIRKAVRDVLVGYNDDVLTFLAPYAQRIKAATENVDLGGGVVPNHRYLAQALRRLKALDDGNCLCTVLVGYAFASPGVESRGGLIDIIKINPQLPSHSDEHLCRCRRCGQHYLVREEAGWHMPSYQWLPYSPPEEALTG